MNEAIGGRHRPAPHGFVLASAHRARLHRPRLPVRARGRPNAVLYYNDYEAEGLGAEVRRGLQPGHQPAQAGRADRRRRLADAQDQSIPHPATARQQRAAAGGLGRRDRDHRDGRAHRAARRTRTSCSSRRSRTATLWRFCLDAAELSRRSSPGASPTSTRGYRASFRGFGDALIYNTSYQPKPAYTALQQRRSRRARRQPPPAPTGLTATAGNAPGRA